MSLEACKRGRKVGNGGLKMEGRRTENSAENMIGIGKRMNFVTILAC